MVTLSSPFPPLPIELTQVIFGFIPDTQGKHDFTLASKACNGIASDYNTSLEEGWQSEREDLINAVAQRDLSTWERVLLGHPFAVNPRPEEQEKYVYAKATLDTFYKAFIDRCIQFNVGYERMGYCFLLAVEGLKKSAAAHNSEEEDVFKMKLSTTIQDFTEKVIIEVAEDFASQPAECITIEAFVEKAWQMREIQSASNMLLKTSLLENSIDGEFYLRNALQCKHSDVFFELSKSYLDRDPSNPKVAAIRKRLTSELENTPDDLVLNSKARIEANRIAHFYEQLTLVVSVQKKAVYYNSLHEILGI